MPDQAPWFIVGPLMGLCVVALYALANQRLGVTGSYIEVLARARGRPQVQPWRIWFFLGLFGGALIVALLRGGPTFQLGYGALGALLPLGLLVPVLFVSGIFVGLGGRWAGGCTSGHGLSGSASLSPASLVATATFIGTGILVTFALHVLTGGAL